MALNLPSAREAIHDFAFRRLLVEDLGWSNPPKGAKPRGETVDGQSFELVPIAELSGVHAFEVHAADGRIPATKSVREKLHKAVGERHHEHLLIFVDKARTQTLWSWLKREGARGMAREHLYMKGQPGDLFLSKLAGLCFEMEDMDDAGHVPLPDVLLALKDSLDIEKVTKKFFTEFSEKHLNICDLIQGVPDEHDRHWYASVLLNRLMFIWFLQKKGFLDQGNMDYLADKFSAVKKKGRNLFFQDFLIPLFFEGFAKPADKRSPQTQKLLGEIKYLNGGLFLPHPVEQRNPKLGVPDSAFEQLFGLFSRYSWNLDDSAGGKDDEIRPEVLGYIFEKYINQKAFGAYYTRPEITEYLCESTIHRLILDAINTPKDMVIPTGFKAYRHESVADLLLALDAPTSRRLLEEVLPTLSLLDPACGSGAFLVAAMKTLIDIYSAIIGRIEFLGDRGLSAYLAKVRKEHPSPAYFIKKEIIKNNLFGVDLMDEATEICRLRLFLALVASARTADELEPLPNLDFNILAGNSLMGLLRVEEKDWDKDWKDSKGTTQSHIFLHKKSLKEILEEKNRKISVYRNTASYTEDLTALRDSIEKNRQEAEGTLNDILLGNFDRLGIKYEEASWDAQKNEEGKPKKRAVKIEDVERLKPFHWGYEFDKVLERGGFDAIITNPPWDIFKPDSKEFFQKHSDLIQKKKTGIHDFEAQKIELMDDRAIKKTWLDYLSEFPHVSAYYRSAPEYANQISVVNGKKSGTDINLYKLFTERCVRLLRPGGLCGIVIPSGIYTDLGTKQLREMLFLETEVTGLFGMSNEKYLFEGIHHAFKFCLLSFRKGGPSGEFWAAFRINPREAIGAATVERFLHDHGEHVRLNVPLIRKLSPDSLSIMEFKSTADVKIAEKMLKWPRLGEEVEGKWRFALCNDFHTTNDSDIFKTDAAKSRLVLFEGKAMWQFDPCYSEPRYWVDEKEGRKRLLGRSGEKGHTLGYQEFRLAYRRQASSTNERTLVATITPKTFHVDNLASLILRNDADTRVISDGEQLFLCAVLNSFVADYSIRQRVTTNLNFFYLYQLPVPRLTAKDPAFLPIVTRAAKLICTTPAFDDLARAVFGPKATSASVGITKDSPGARMRLRAELDGLIAHLYELTEDEFIHILGAFPLVAEPVKIEARNAYREARLGMLK